MNKTLGIVGGGQLGLMLAEAAQKLGVQVVVLDPTPQCPASRVAEQVVGDFKDHDTVLGFAARCDVMTFEIESANAHALEELAQRGFPVHPTPKTLAIIKDKLAQKNRLQDAGVAVAPFLQVDSAHDAERAGEQFGYPFVLKTRSGGYDGRGNALVESAADIPGALTKLGGMLYAEKFVPFVKELAVVAARTSDGQIAVYPVVETMHEDHICRTVLMPAPVPATVSKSAEKLAHRALEIFDGAGVFGIEMFLTGDGDVLINEIAPRVHNSGHVTIEANETSQFEQHVRAVLGMPLGSVALKHPANVMVNILGARNDVAEPKGVEEAQAIQGVTVHLYGKLETRVQRKMGHLTAVAMTLEEAQRNAEQALTYISI